jgi:hypothetical protein
MAMALKITDNNRLSFARKTELHITQVPMTN